MHGRHVCAWSNIYHLLKLIENKTELLFLKIEVASLVEQKQC